MEKEGDEGAKMKKGKRNKNWNKVRKEWEGRKSKGGNKDKRKGLANGERGPAPRMCLGPCNMGIRPCLKAYFMFFPFSERKNRPI